MPTAPAPVTDAELRHVAESLSEVEDLWTKLSSLADPTIPCPDCGGTGTIAGGGIFGEVPCDRCDGRRVVEHPAADQLQQLARPDFPGMRYRLQGMTAAHDRAQREAYLGKGDGKSPVSRDELVRLEQDIAKVREEGRGIALAQAKGAAPAGLRSGGKYGSLGSGGEE